jgi:hypothetical protein
VTVLCLLACWLAGLLSSSAAAHVVNDVFGTRSHCADGPRWLVVQPPWQPQCTHCLCRALSKSASCAGQQALQKDRTVKLGLGLIKVAGAGSRHLAAQLLQRQPPVASRQQYCTLHRYMCCSADMRLNVRLGGSDAANVISNWLKFTLQVCSCVFVSCWTPSSSC